jgi:sulfate adenylyltransferase subunit 1 (EFTu-like GTPase family)
MATTAMITQAHHGRFFLGSDTAFSDNLSSCHVNSSIYTQIDESPLIDTLRAARSQGIYSKSHQKLM